MTQRARLTGVFLLVTAACDRGPAQTTPSRTATGQPETSSPTAELSAAVVERPAAAPEPRTVEEAIVVVKQWLPPDELAKFRAGSEHDTYRYHHGLGTRIRNELGLWQGGQLREYFIEHGVAHPDDMSSIILAALWCDLNGTPLGLEKRCADAQASLRLRAAPRDLEPGQPPACPTSLSPTLVRAAMGPDQIRRVIHAGICPADGALWAWEYERGWYTPDANLRGEIEDGLNFRKPRPASSR